MDRAPYWVASPTCSKALPRLGVVTLVVDYTVVDCTVVDYTVVDCTVVDYTVVDYTVVDYTVVLAEY